MSLFYAVRVGGLLTHVVALLLDTGSLTCEIAQIVKLSATNLTNLVHLNAVDVWRLKGEDTLYTNGTRHLANSEALLLSMTADLNDNATVELDTLFRTLDNFVSDSDGVTSLELCQRLRGKRVQRYCFFLNLTIKKVFFLFFSPFFVFLWP